MVESLPHRWYGPTERDNPDDEPFDELANNFSSPLHQSIIRNASALLGVPHHLSIHPGGIVISPQAITDLTPIQMAAKGMIITQFDLESIEQLGLVKIDLLGIRGLTVLGDVVEAVNSGVSTLPHPRLGSLDDIPEEDRDTSEWSAGKTIGCFQIESPGMRSRSKEIQASP
jgi:DNA polymerase-3 subunit alpha/error-prone DNA polymerase